MPFGIDDIRRFGGTDRILFDPDAQGTGLLSVNRWQRFKSYWDIAGARGQNGETVDAIRQAIRNDQDLGDDLKTLGNRLLDGVRLDRAIGAAQIKGIVKELDDLSTAAALDQRIQTRLAAVSGKLSPELRACGDAMAAIAKKLAERDVAAGTKPGAVDIAARVDEAAGVCRTAIQAAKPDAGEAEPALTGMVGRNVLRFVQKPDGSIRTKEEIQSAVQKTCKFYFAAAEAAQQSLIDGKHLTGEAALLDARHAVEQARQAALEFVRDAGEPVDDALFQAVETHAAKLPMQELRHLGPESTPSEILGAIRQFTRAADPATLELPEGVAAPSTPRGQAALMRFICRWAALQMPTDARRALHDLLVSASGGKARSLPATLAERKDSAAVKEHAAGTDLTTFLHKLEGNPGGPLAAVSTNAKITDFSPADRCAYRPENAFSGSAADTLRGAILGGAGILAPGGDPAKRLHDRIDRGTRRFLDGYFAATMKALSDALAAEFKEGQKEASDAKDDAKAPPPPKNSAEGAAKPKDDKPDASADGAPAQPPAKDAPDPAGALRARYRHAFDTGFPFFEGCLGQSKGSEDHAPLFRLPGGAPLSVKDPEAARNELARMATGRADAEYATLSPEDRARTNVFIALLSCDPFKAVERGVRSSLSPEGDRNAFALAGDKHVGRVFTVSGSAKDGFVIRCGREHLMDGVEFGRGDAKTTVPGSGSAAFQLEIRMSPEDLDNLAKRNWSGYVPAAFEQEAGKSQFAPGKLEQAVPEEYRFGAHVSAAFAVDFDQTAPTVKPMPKIRNLEELKAFVASLDDNTHFGTVSEGAELADADEVKRKTFTFGGIVFRGADRSWDGLKESGGFKSQNALSEIANWREAAGLGTGPKGKIISRGATGKSGVSTAKTPLGALIYRGKSHSLYVIDTTKIPRGEHPWEGKAWDMDRTYSANGFGEEKGKVPGAMGGEVNCSGIPLSAVIGRIEVSDEAQDATDPAVRMAILKKCPIEFNPDYKPDAAP